MPKKLNPIEEILAAYPVMILDGALATELERHGCHLDDPLWSAKVLLENPELIYQVHTDYFRAGADCAITASYQATVDGFSKRGMEEAVALDLIKKTVQLAKKARDDFWEGNEQANRPKPLVAASIGPYGAYLADGSEYRGNYGVTDEVLAAFHRPRMAALIEAGVDVLAIETIPSLQEARVLASLVKEFPEAYAWLSFSLKNDAQISDGTPLEKCADLLDGNSQIASIGINCAPASLVAESVKRLSARTEKPVIVYPNSGEAYDAATKTWHGHESDHELDHESDDWYRAGARLIGGCCRTGPQHIERLSEKWRAAEKGLERA
ncbi:homocysteine S-methyltransferase [Metabacillus sp. FJAT-52054]|uniref:Homocysteine S-methyltransferase n=1 Tax=Metabacillus sediminis TaxID=3117746 RepID=A0ABZ2NHL2_9BACI